ncbi:uncharacterized protein LOC141500042 isoform X2 [Macrotis lagotis]|uniref:uncharacterized protein LOC141500042 isoform X2 n=1 Tax=Macrotis lagotis TaxID=92651 RepID=UPI003D68E09F
MGSTEGETSSLTTSVSGLRDIQESSPFGTTPPCTWNTRPRTRSQCRRDDSNSSGGQSQGTTSTGGRSQSAPPVGDVAQPTTSAGSRSKSATSTGGRSKSRTRPQTTCSSSLKSKQAPHEGANAMGLDAQKQLFVCLWGGVSMGQAGVKACGQITSDLFDLAEHVTSKHLKRNNKGIYVCRWHNCPRQGNPFNARFKLVNHIRVHTGEKPFICNFLGCYKTFTRVENLKIHRRSHTGERPFKCPFEGCTKSFASCTDRKKHATVHSCERPYVCNIQGCQKAYTHPSSLRKHRKQHVSKVAATNLTDIDNPAAGSSSNTFLTTRPSRAQKRMAPTMTKSQNGIPTKVLRIHIPRIDDVWARKGFAPLVHPPALQSANSSTIPLGYLPVVRLGRLSPAVIEKFTNPSGYSPSKSPVQAVTTPSVIAASSNVISQALVHVVPKPPTNIFSSLSTSRVFQVFNPQTHSGPSPSPTNASTTETQMVPLSLVRNFSHSTRTTISNTSIINPARFKFTSLQGPTILSFPKGQFAQNTQFSVSFPPIRQLFKFPSCMSPDSPKLDISFFSNFKISNPFAFLSNLGMLGCSGLKMIKSQSVEESTMATIDQLQPKSNSWFGPAATISISDSGTICFDFSAASTSTLRGQLALPEAQESERPCCSKDVQGEMDWNKAKYEDKVTTISEETTGGGGGEENDEYMEVECMKDKEQQVGLEGVEKEEHMKEAGAGEEQNNKEHIDVEGGEKDVNMANEDNEEECMEVEWREEDGEQMEEEEKVKEEEGKEQCMEEAVKEEAEVEEELMQAGGEEEREEDMHESKERGGGEEHMEEEGKLKEGEEKDDHQGEEETVEEEKEECVGKEVGEAEKGVEAAGGLKEDGEGKVGEEDQDMEPPVKIPRLSSIEELGTNKP